MDKIEKLRQAVQRLYEAKYPGRDEWADWVYPNHVLIVAKNAADIAGRFGIDQELSEAAALLHDIADTVMPRAVAAHEAKSMEIARGLLQDSGYGASQIEEIVGDAIRFHSCKGRERPVTDVGKVLATADAVTHFRSDFYAHAVDGMRERQNFNITRRWVLDKLERDFNQKIFFEPVKKEIEADYLRLKQQFSKEASNVA